MRWRSRQGDEEVSRATLLLGTEEPDRPKETPPSRANFGRSFFASGSWRKIPITLINHGFGEGKAQVCVIA
jgi:hypothetical protein